MGSLVYRLYRDWEPEEGWLPFVLLLAIASTIITAVTTADWVPESGVISWTVLLSLMLSIFLARRHTSSKFSLLLLTAYGLSTTIIFLAHLIPPINILSAGISQSLTYIRQNLFLFGDRIGGWTEAVFNGQSSEETIVFALGLGLVSWGLVAYAGWTTYRQQNPLNGMILIGSALALNTLYSRADFWTLLIFVMLAVMLTSVVHMADMKIVWDRKKIDYPTDISLELLLTAFAISLALMTLAFFLPAISIDAITRAFVEQPVIQQAEESLERVFSGVNIEESNFSRQLLARGSGNTLPRSFLLGNPPELAETLVMTATVQIPETAVTPIWPLHWRAYSYDGYNGRGWFVSSERQETIPAGERLPLPPINTPLILTQSVYWQFGSTNTRYTMGLPLRFDHEVQAHWRGLSDLSQVRGRTVNYTAESQTITATPDDLRQANLQDVPEAILARYTILPDDIPERVLDLARDVAQPDPQNPASTYEQAKAIEQFLRQYPYSLDVSLPPRNQDLVDFFLFDLQSGYCDYYATSMVVMARSLGIPSRFATGFLAQKPDENGVQSIYQLNAHSWPEIYFAGYGWVEFEPTAPFPNQSESEQLPEFGTFQPPEFLFSDPLDLPPQSPANSSSLLANGNFILVSVLFLLVLAFFIWMVRKKPVEQEPVLAAYGRLQRSANKLGQPTPQSQTPHEFEAGFKEHINRLADRSRTAKRILDLQASTPAKSQALTQEAAQLTDLFLAHQYSDHGADADGSREANLIWQRIRLRLWLLSLLNKVGRFFKRP